MTDIICSECNELKRHYSKGLCNVCWQKMYGTPKRYHDETCEILTEHAEQHKDDGDKLSTDFIADQLNKFKTKRYDKKDIELLEQRPNGE